MNAMKNALAVFAILAALAGMAEEKGTLGTAFQDLQKDDQVEFVRAVNESMRTYKASTPEKRLQTIYAVNRDAVRAAPAKEKKAVIAEVFATAPMDALPTITDRFATELFSRKAAGFSDKDDSFTEFAAATLMRVRTRMRFLATHELPAARMTFAVIMVLKASEGNPADLRESVLFYIPTGSHELARKVWIPAALGEDGNAPSYQPILAAGEKGEEPAHVSELQIAPVQELNRLVGSELRVGDAKDVTGPTPAFNGNGLGTGEGMGAGLGRVPRAASSDPDSPWYRRRRGDDPEDPSPVYVGQGL